MRILLIPLFVGCAKPAAPVAATPDSGRPAPGASDVDRPLLLWEARKGSAVSTLMGTCHLSIPIEHALPPEYQVRLTTARVLVNEIDLAASADPARAMPLVWNGDYDLREVIGPENFHSLATSVRMAMPAPMLIHTRPWFAATSRMAKTDVKIPILDGQVSRMAREAERATRALETLEEQVDVMERFDDLFVDELRPMSDAELEERQEVVDAMIAGCIDADMTAISRAMESRSGAQMSPELLDARNQNWAPAVLEEAERGGMFLAVGAGHMGGETGMLALLADEGFEITQLSTDRPSSARRSVIEPNPPLQALELPSPEVVQAWVDAWAAPEGPLAGMCAEDQVVQQCFPPTGGTCLDALRHDATLCAATFVDLLPASVDEPLSGTTARQVFGCTLTGSIMAAVAEDRVTDSPVCGQLMQKMNQASGAAVGNP